MQFARWNAEKTLPTTPRRHEIEFEKQWLVIRAQSKSKNPAQVSCRAPIERCSGKRFGKIADSKGQVPRA